MDTSYIGGMAATGALQGGFGILSSYLNNKWAQEREKAARKENFEYGEMSANAADARTRALYRDLQSPEALLQQYRAAGLSPSLMFGGGGVGGQTTQGAQGAGAAGVNPNVFGIPPIDFAQIKLANSQAAKNKAEAENINKDTEIKELEKTYKDMTNKLFGIDFEVMTSFLKDKEGNTYSLYEIAEGSATYEDFIKTLKSMDGYYDEMYSTEHAQKLLRGIYIASNTFERDIAVLSAETTSAKFQQSIVNCLSKEGFANQNAKAAVQDLKRNVQTAELDERQSKAWNNLLNRLEKKNSTVHDIIIIVSMLVNNALSNYKGTAIVPTHKFNDK